MVASGSGDFFFWMAGERDDANRPRSVSETLILTFSPTLREMNEVPEYTVSGEKKTSSDPFTDTKP